MLRWFVSAVLTALFVLMAMPVMAQDSEASRQQQLPLEIHAGNTNVRSDEFGELWQGFWVSVTNHSKRPVRGISIQGRQLLITEGYGWSGIIGEVYQNGVWIGESDEIALAGEPGVEMVLFPDTIPGLAYDWKGYTITIVNGVKPNAKPIVWTCQGDDFLWEPGAEIGTIPPRSTVTLSFVFHEFVPEI